MNPNAISCWTAGSICGSLESAPLAAPVPARPPRTPPAESVCTCRQPTATRPCPTGAPAAAASCCPRSPSASGTTSAQTAPPETQAAILRRAFDLGITHFDLANNYGPPPGSAERTLGRALATDFAHLRDEIVISTKAGYHMWDGPYGEWGSRKYLRASLDQSLRRLGVEYVDVFYSHRPDPGTPLEETMGALDTAVRQGKALYAGLSNYSAAQTREAAAILQDLGTPLLIHQPRYSMLDRRIEADGLPDVLDELGVGSIAYSPLEQGILTDRYLYGIPAGSRAARREPLPDRRRRHPAAGGAAPRARRPGQGARPVARAARAGVGAARRTTPPPSSARAV